MTKVWNEQGHKITVITGMYDLNKAAKYPFCNGRLFKRETNDNGLDVIRVHTTNKYNKNFLWRAWAYFTFMFFGLWAGMFFAKGRYDVVLATSPPLTVGPLGILLSMVKRCPFIFEIRDLWPKFAIDTGVLTNPLLIKLMYFMERISYKKAAAINALTPAFKQELIEENAIDPGKIWMIPNAADLDVIKPGPRDENLRKKYGWGDKFVGFYMGAHGKANCLWQLIDAAEILKNEPEIHIACVGGGMERDALIERVKQKGLTNIEFLPAVDKTEINAHLNAIDVSLVVLKKLDAFKTVYPNKMFDSMSAAKPIILAIDGVARNVVEQAGCGMFVEPENAQQIAEKMRFYRKSLEILNEHGQNGYKYVCENYDRHKLASEYIQLIQNLVNKKH